ncbi:DUF4913 domain-containing protein [Pseudonocardia oroxyli]|uniref:DUF4913 domain-containing protein n=1 Tax=Pseudonocardia oroxyli TaxID=366584 RepID=A0A1G7WXU2_PSEOR|nr:DUF4913 domain-containing protein [Pseudonocardia oroxyli]SDG76752.1 protein of unknown function [Pseudonocardia oroxyli]
MTDDDLAARVAALESWQDHQTRLTDSLMDRGGPDEDDVPTAVLDPGRLVRWVHRHVTAIIARPLRGQLYWCPLWWEHPEAVFRLEALRRAWQDHVALPGASMSIWIRDHLDPCLRVLLAADGPFVDCAHDARTEARGTHLPLPPLPTAHYPRD